MKLEMREIAKTQFLVELIFKQISAHRLHGHVVTGHDVPSVAYPH